jgi:hypothetical protein
MHYPGPERYLGQRYHDQRYHDLMVGYDSAFELSHEGACFCVTLLLPSATSSPTAAGFTQTQIVCALC